MIVQSRIITLGTMSTTWIATFPDASPRRKQKAQMNSANNGGRGAGTYFAIKLSTIQYDGKRLPKIRCVRLAVVCRNPVKAVFQHLLRLEGTFGPRPESVTRSTRPLPSFVFARSPRRMMEGTPGGAGGCRAYQI